jgi:hypothetical protein
MASSVAVPGPTSATVRKCSFCAEEILAEAKKCKHCGEFVNGRISKGVGAIFAAGVVVACLLAGMKTAPSEGILAVGVWAVFAILFAKTFGRG